MDEFDRTGTIDESVIVAHESGRGEGRLDTHFMLAGFLAGVADAGARIDRALARYGAGTRQDRFEKRGLAALEGAHQRDAPGTLWATAVSNHGNLPELAGSWTKYPALAGIVSGNAGAGKGRRTPRNCRSIKLT